MAQARQLFLLVIVAIIVISVAALVLFRQTSGYINVNAETAQQLIKDGVRVIDVREPEEYAAGHIPGSELIPLGSILTESKNWDKSESILLVCRSGNRSRQAAELLTKAGFSRLYNLEGGVLAWQGPLAK